MSTSDNRRKQILRTAFFYTLITLFCVIFGAVYEQFSHGVYSYKMIYAFAVPLILGTIVLFLIALRAGRFPNSGSLLYWNCGVAALTIGLLFNGVLDIYGTTNQWIIVYYIAAGILLVTGIVLYLYSDKKDLQPASEDIYETADSRR